MVFDWTLGSRRVLLLQLHAEPDPLLGDVQEVPPRLQRHQAQPVQPAGAAVQRQLPLPALGRHRHQETLLAAREAEVGPVGIVCEFSTRNIKFALLKLWYSCDRAFFTLTSKRKGGKRDTQISCLLFHLISYLRLIINSESPCGDINLNTVISNISFANVKDQCRLFLFIHYWKSKLSVTQHNIFRFRNKDKICDIWHVCSLIELYRKYCSSVLCKPQSIPDIIVTGNCLIRSIIADTGSPRSSVNKFFSSRSQ